MCLGLGLLAFFVCSSLEVGGECLLFMVLNCTHASPSPPTFHRLSLYDHHPCSRTPSVLDPHTLFYRSRWSVLVT